MKIQSHFALFSFTLFLTLVTFCPAAIVIDDFSTTQTIPGGNNYVTGNDMIGGERDAVIIYDYAEADINKTVSDQLYYRSGNAHFNYINLVYDGIDGSYDNHDHGGLGHLDLTEGGTCNGFVFDFTQVPPYTVNMWVSVFQEGDRQGFGWTSVTNSPQTVFLPFANFIADPPLSAPPPTGLAFSSSYSLIDFTDVGYIHIEMAIWGGDDTFVLDSIKTDLVPEPTSLALLTMGGLVLRRRRQTP